jgi:hypothetical protein
MRDPAVTWRPPGSPCPSAMGLALGLLAGKFAWGGGYSHLHGLMKPFGEI